MELQGRLAHSGTHQLTPTDATEVSRLAGLKYGRMASAEICAGACSTTSTAEECSGFFQPTILCERDDKHARICGSDILMPPLCRRPGT